MYLGTHTDTEGEKHMNRIKKKTQDTWSTAKISWHYKHIIYLN